MYKRLWACLALYIEVINITMVGSQGRGADFFSIGGKVP